MKVIHGLDDRGARLACSVLSVGNFDGVHRGHQEIIARARSCAAGEAEDTPTVVMVFEPHPLAVVAPAKAPPLLTKLHRKLDYLSRLGVDITIVAASTPEFLGLEPERFIREIVVDRLHPKHIVEGRNFGFGRGRQGDVATLIEYADRYGYEVHVVDPVQQEMPDGDTVRVSSSLIRKLLLAGRAELAARALGRPYAMEGQVVTGIGRGHPLGFPTANLDVTGQLIPADGVYAASVSVDDTAYACALSVGSTPTFDEHVRRIEAHLLDFEGSLYGRTLTVRLLRRLREQRKFASAQELSRQIEADVRLVRQE